MRGIFTPPNKIAHPLGAVRRSALGVVFGNTTSDPKVRETQNFLNPHLKRLGYTQLDPDGKLGKATCGAQAWSFAQDIDINAAPFTFFEVWNVCASSSQSPPTPITAAAKSSPYQQAVQTLQAKAGDPVVVTAAQQALNVGLKAMGMCAIGVDGSAGPETCGAQVWLIANAGGDGLTQAQRDAIYPKCSVGEKTAPGKCPAPSTLTPIVVEPVPTPGPIGPVGPVKPKIAAATMAAGVGIAAVLAAAWHFYAQKKAGGG